MSFGINFAVGQDPYGFVADFGTKGSGEGEFNVPHSIAFDSKDNMYITDEENNRIQKFTSNGTFLTEWGSKGTDDGEFNRPEGIDLDSLGYVYVADTGNSRVQKFTSNGNFVTKSNP